MRHHDDPSSLLAALLAALDERDPTRAAQALWPLLGPRPAAQVGDEAGLARLLGNDRHRPLLAPAARHLRALDARERAARAELTVTPSDGDAPHDWLITLAQVANGRWFVSGLQREGFEG